MFKKLALSSVLAAGSIGSAFAAVPADVTTALTDMKSDALIVAAAFLVAIIAVAAFKLMRKGA